MRSAAALASAALLLGGLGGLAACDDKKPLITPITKASPGTYLGFAQTPPGKRPEFQLVDTQGNAFDFQKQTAGKPTLLYFGYTRCPDECPTAMHDLHAALKLVKASVRDQVQVYFVTTDPKRDTPTVLSRWLQEFDSTFVGLTGTEAQIAAAEKAAGVPIAEQDASAQLPNAAGYSVNHAAVVLAYDTANALPVFFPSGTTVDTYAHDISLLAKES